MSICSWRSSVRVVADVVLPCALLPTVQLIDIFDDEKDKFARVRLSAVCVCNMKCRRAVLMSGWPCGTFNINPQCTLLAACLLSFCEQTQAFVAACERELNACLESNSLPGNNK